MDKFRLAVRIWLPLMAAIVLSSGLTYGVAQQALRQSANDPQIAMAEDAAIQLEDGDSAAQVVGPLRVAMERSLSPYLMVFDADGAVLASGAQLRGSTPALPSGVFTAARQGGQNRITWQPEPGVRHAIVVAPVNGGTGGYVLAGRSLREVEKRTDGILTITLVGGIAGMLAVTAACVVLLIL